MPKLVLINPAPVPYQIARRGFKIQPLSLAYLAALTPDEWTIEICDENYEDASCVRKADLVGITTLTSTINRAYDIARRYRNEKIPVILGGIHASMVPEEAGRFADAVVIGEAENVWPRLIDDLTRGRLQKLYQGDFADFKKPFFPKRELMSKEYTFGSIQTSRGCPLDCEFCSVKAFNGAQFRQREIDDVMREMATIPQKMLFFTDDNLVGYSAASRERVKDLFRQMIEKKVNKKWFCQTSINVADDDDLLRLARLSGCMMVLVGIESIDENVLKGNMNKQINTRKGVQYYYKLIEKLHGNGIVVLGTMVFGSDEAGSDNFEKTTKFYKKSGLDIPWPGILTPYPGTKLFERLTNEKRIRFSSYPEDWLKYNSTIVIHPKKETAAEFYVGFYSFVKENYSYFKILVRLMRAFLFSKSIVKALVVYNFNRSLRERYEKGLRSPDEYSILSGQEKT
jgi:radical SAM superfamily enzyme YgiQ (UPF0313 family)